ncbi:SDR family NAD(P)-dependent oxidoreductase [Rhodococcoides fascians]|uniref:SDR family NAD(P)-dependent oxidoreductase n=1 Tax=Rhodococcoides fascians TaxID=1828 RepID=UPI0005693751|nr:SDR family NAD(P)-dependent oxidoreductase [Rhodococcus fascians]
MAPGTAVIVGVGPGLGLALALALARVFADAGHPVALLARDTAKLETYAAEIGSSTRPVRGYTVDAGIPASLRSALHAAIGDLGAPEVLVYNAAVLRGDTPTDGDDDGRAHALAVDVLGAKVAAEPLLPELAGGRGSLLFTGGGLAIHPSPEFASMSVCKAALRAYVQTLHKQLQGTGVRATSVTITGSIGGQEKRFDPTVLASAYLELHRQPMAEWEHELLRN